MSTIKYRDRVDAVDDIDGEASASINASTVLSSSNDTGHCAKWSSTAEKATAADITAVCSTNDSKTKKPGSTKSNSQLDYLNEESNNSDEQCCRLGIPSITTTISDCTSEYSPSNCLPWLNGGGSKFDITQANFSGSRIETLGDRIRVEVRRRSASFCGPDKIKSERRLSHGGISFNSRRKSTFLTKTLSFIKNKMDFSSTSTLYPSREEMRQWEKSFESLLNHKYGCLTFREFLKTEYSTENLDFWLECEEFKKMKDGKKATQQRAHAIYDQYIATQSPREVNLDADTKTATKLALEEGAKPDMFSLAQNRIEHLMEKDSYPRFLKSDGFLKLLGDNAEIISSEITVKVIPPGAETMQSFSA